MSCCCLQAFAMDMFHAAIGNPFREELASVLSNPYDRHPHQSLPGWAPDRDWVPAGSSNTRQGDILQVARERNNSNTIDLYYIFFKKNNLKFLKKKLHHKRAILSGILTGMRIGMARRRWERLAVTRRGRTLDWRRGGRARRGG